MGDRRDATTDVLRGLAIFTMVAANMAADVLAEPHPFYVRLYGTFAAPLFVFLSGMMVSLTAQTKGRGLKYFLVRGVLVVCVGALIDMLIWKIYPFHTVEILYLIGISLPLAYLCSRLNGWSMWLVIVIVFLVTPALQAILGYGDYPTEVSLSGEETIKVENRTKILTHWLVDGWFPVFPWVGFSLLGLGFGKLRWVSSTPFRRKAVFLAGSAVVGLGIVIWWLHPGAMLVRDGYSELFYPPTLGYMMTAIGVILLLFVAVDLNPELFIFGALRPLGEAALLMYILHLALIEYFITRIWKGDNLGTFVVVYLGLTVFLILVAYSVRHLKRAWVDRPFLVRFLLGG